MKSSEFRKIFLILGDQLCLDHPFLKSALLEEGSTLLMIESLPRAEWLPYHPQKLLFVFACMRRFAHEVRENFPNIDLRYIEFSENTIGTEINNLNCSELHLVEPSEPKALEWIEEVKLKCRLIIHPSPFFLADESMLSAKPPYLLESFYRAMRVKFDILMDGKKPRGGQWNFDEDNRKPPLKSWNIEPPQDFFSEDWTDAVDAKIYSEVEKTLRKVIPDDRFGIFRRPTLPTHRNSARRFLDDFINKRLDSFGPYEDAMIFESVGLFHSGLSAVMNLQIISAGEIVKAVESASGNISLASREGFIRQVIGWREFVRLIYLRHRSEYSSANFFGFSGKLPPLYWGKETDMKCLASAVAHVSEFAYSHHILRLMVLGNFALLTETSPFEINRWFWSAYIDAYEWVVTPNVMGMSQFADGGLFATKPYISGGNYINKMSTFCKSCKYNPKETLNEGGCPFNALYWDFVERTQSVSTHRASFSRRMGMMWKLWEKKSDAEKSAIREKAQWLRVRARSGEL